MTGDTDHLVLEILRQIRSDMVTVRTEMRDGFNRLDVSEAWLGGAGASRDHGCFGVRPR